MALFYAQQFATTKISVGGGIDASQTTGIVLQSVTGIDITKPGVLCLSWADPLDTSVYEYITYTSIDGSNELQGVTRGVNSTGRSHLNESDVAWVLSEEHINTLNDAVAIGGSATTHITGTVDEDDMASNSAVKLATQQSIKAYADTKSLQSKTGTLTRDLTAASGDVAYTGVGFQPTSITFYGALSDHISSIGYAGSSKAGTGVFYNKTTAGLLSEAGANTVIYGQPASANYQTALVKSYDADGFTLTWSKTSSPTGTLKVSYIAYK